MKVFKYIDRISLMHKLIKEQKTGSPEDFASRLGIKRARLYELIDELKSYNVPIHYSKSTKSFYYDQPYDIKMICIMKPLNEKEQVENNGGLIYYSPFFMDATLLL